MANRELTPEQKALAQANLAKAREAKAKKAAPFPEPQEGEVAPRPLELTEDERQRIRAEARKKIEAELKAKEEADLRGLMAKELDAEILRQRREAGLIDYRDDIVDILINVGPFADQIVVDGTIYQHGQWYKVDRRRYDSLREIMARSWEAEDRAGNPNRKFERERQLAGVINPLAREGRLSDGSFTLGGDPRVHGVRGTVVGAPTYSGI